ncbi:hypothetical protein PVAR5_4311 [Paecilomyces variotii No. 5]|uniref:Uncharacterized protein n=1 Tax=Byssochlamys spectabilis (strain No. 5 / NBRC 109023) TaxID=1356009 RepID=V5HZY6_BYSSN|nr:hypothetical protein PVAR5_4311 [Paecilomyces variotii No. 5]
MRPKTAPRQAPIYVTAELENPTSLVDSLITAAQSHPNGSFRPGFKFMSDDIVPETTRGKSILDIIRLHGPHFLGWNVTRNAVILDNRSPVDSTAVIAQRSEMEHFIDYSDDDSDDSMARVGDEEYDNESPEQRHQRLLPKLRQQAEDEQREKGILWYEEAEGKIFQVFHFRVRFEDVAYILNVLSVKPLAREYTERAHLDAEGIVKL